MEMLTVFVRFLLSITPSLPPDAQASAQAKRQQRYEGFIEALGQRLQKGQSLLSEIPEDVLKRSSRGAHGGQGDPSFIGSEVRAASCPATTLI
jgi:hypothetical protein